MAKIDIDLNPTTILTIDAIGKPGERVFYVQGKSEEQTITLLVEKIHVQTLALGIEHFLSELKQKFPDLPDIASDYDEENMRITPPVDPLFRVGDLSLGYDAELDLMVLIAHQDPRGIDDENEIGVVRYWCTRSQIVALAHWGVEVAGRGRPVWPSSGEPILPADQFSPKNNGHKH